MTWDDTHPNILAGTTPRIFVTNADTPEEARTFVYGKTQWLERIEDVSGSGAVDFSPVADSEEELREWLMEQDLDIDEIDPEDNDFARMVRDEFVNQTPLYPEAEEESLSDREP
jgi:hypothetical protein